MLASVVSILVLLLAIFTVVGNWACVLATYRLRRQGSKRHVSTVPLVAQVLVAVAAVISHMATSQLLPVLLFWVVALSDPALFSILYLPVFFLLSKFRARI